MVVDLLYEFNSLVELLLLDVGSSRQDDRTCVLDLILVELGEVLKIYLALACVDNGYRTADLRVVDLLNCCDYIGELAYARRLDNDTVGVESVDNVLKCSAEVSYERAADTAGIHLRNLDACLLQEASVDTDLSELILDQYDLLLVVAVGDKLLYERCLSGSQES